ncbi:hypothetical protein [[Eubacterium] hominis]|uniref:hypothetical protein n=1 Tax=[Eubacterium] hominis TaxID=2764325 RepID=UPI003A4DEEEF
MKIKNDDALSFLRSFGFRCCEHTGEGFIRYHKTIGNMIVTIANGQFENKIRISLLQDKEGRIRTSYKDILEYTEMIGSMIDAGLIAESASVDLEKEEALDEIELMENPLISFPRKPEGFMAQ